MSLSDPNSPDQSIRESNGAERSRATGAAALIVLGCTLLLCSVTQLWYLKVDQPVGFDEGYIGAMALRLLESGMLPGVDGVGQRGPVFYWLVAIAQLLGGRFHWHGVRWLAWIAACAVVLGLYALGRFNGKPLAGALGGAFFAYVMYGEFAPGSGIAVTGESICAPFVCFATLATLVAARSPQGRKRERWSLLAGLLAALAGWTKVSFLLVALPLGLWLLVLQSAEPGRRFAVRLHEPLYFAVGWALPLLFLLVIYAMAGALDEFVYRFFTYNAKVHMGAVSDTYRWDATREWLAGNAWRFTSECFVASLCALLLYLYRLVYRAGQEGLPDALSGTGLTVLGFAQLYLAYASGIAQFRFWDHHFVAAIPWVGLLGGLALCALVDRLGRRKRFVSMAGVWLLAAASLWPLGSAGQATRTREEQRRQGGWVPAGNDPLCHAIGSRTGPEDTIFIWGFDGDLYVSCARNPASRFVYTTLIAGIVPPFWSSPQKSLVARGARSQAAADIAAARPALIIDIPKSLHGFSVNRIGTLHRQISRDYCQLGEFTGFNGRSVFFYGREDRGFCENRKQR